MMARSPSRNMPIASAFTAKPFTDGSVVARSRADSSRLAPSASGSSTPTTPQQESALESHHEHTIEMLLAHLKRILKLDRLRLRGPHGARDEFLPAATAKNLRQLAQLLPLPIPANDSFCPHNLRPP